MPKYHGYFLFLAVIVFVFTCLGIYFSARELMGLNQKCPEVYEVSYFDKENGWVVLNSEICSRYFKQK